MDQDHAWKLPATIRNVRDGGCAHKGRPHGRDRVSRESSCRVGLGSGRLSVSAGVSSPVVLEQQAGGHLVHKTQVRWLHNPHSSYNHTRHYTTVVEVAVVLFLLLEKIFACEVAEVFRRHGCGESFYGCLL